MRKPKEECTLSEYQFFWCEGAGHREAGTAMRPHTICAGCAREWYGMQAAPFDRRCADALADEVAALVRRGIIDSRSPAADALLDYRDPPSTPRADRLAALEAERDAWQRRYRERCGQDLGDVGAAINEVGRSHGEVERLRGVIREAVHKLTNLHCKTKRDQSRLCMAFDVLYPEQG